MGGNKSLLARKSVIATASFLLLLVTLHATAPTEENKGTPVSKEGAVRRQITDPEELLRIIEAQQEQIRVLQQSLDELRKQVEGLVDRPQPGNTRSASARESIGRESA